VQGDYVVSTHCHNDLGLAVANSLSGVAAGARQVEVAVNGIGERAGNAALEEIVMAVKTRPDQFGGLEVNVRTEELARTSRLVSRLTGYPVQYNKAIVGRNAFAHESGIHQHGVLRARDTYEIMDAAAVGQEGGQIVLGKHSGRAGFADALAKIGIALEDDAFRRAFERFKQVADRKVAIGEEELRAIIADEVDSAVERVRLVGLHVSGGNNVTPTATVTVEVDGERQTFDGQGDGMVHASFAAVKQAFAVTDARLVDYRVVPVTSGADAMAEINVVIRIDDRTYSGRAVATDVVEGSAQAFVEALNKVGASRAVTS
jgi:2-isopropylmalate synthase